MFVKILQNKDIYKDNVKTVQWGGGEERYANLLGRSDQKTMRVCTFQL